MIKQNPAEWSAVAEKLENNAAIVMCKSAAIDTLIVTGEQRNIGI